MSMERRLVLFLVLSVALMWGMPALLTRLGLLPEPPKKAAEVVADAQEPDALPVADEPADDAIEPAAPAIDEPAPAPPAITAAPTATDEPEVEAVDPARLVLGSVAPDSTYRLEARFVQDGAGIELLQSSVIEAEIQSGQPRNRPLTLIDSQSEDRPDINPAFSMDLFVLKSKQRGADAGADAGAETEGNSNEARPTSSGSKKQVLHDLGRARRWEVVREGDLYVVPVTKDSGDGKTVEGQQLSFRTTVSDPSGAVVVTKHFRLFPDIDGLELEIDFESSGDQAQEIVYRLDGPQGLPIEGEWFTSTFRDIFFGGHTSAGDEVTTRSAQKVYGNREQQERFTSLPLKYTGVENQYFTVFLLPEPTPTSREQSWIDEVRPIVVAADPKETQKADVSVELISHAIEVEPGRIVSHPYHIYAGPKTAEALAAVDAFELSTFRKGWKLPVVGDLGASFMSKYFIAPMLKQMYAVTRWVAGLFGGNRGSYGVAIILLTVFVRLLLFPLGRKQARVAQKMQSLQPMLVELKKQCGDDKERLTKETFALYKQYGVNPMGGCLPALIQLPVMIGLWQALNNSVSLRHSQFLWIDNLAAPDMLFKLPFTVPFIGGWIGPYFNILPIVVVVLMLIQTKLFSPPPTTPEAEAQQRTMTMMMGFMAFLFYKVPSGLGIYFITSSLWQIGERLLLPKLGLVSPAPTAAGAAAAALEAPARSPKTGSKAAASTTTAKPGASKSGTAAKPETRGWFAGLRAQAQKRMEAIMEDAAKDRTVRNEPDRAPKRGGDRGKQRPRRG